MATTTAAISVASTDLTGNTLAVASTSTLYKAGTVIGLDQTTGLSSKYYAAAQTNLEIVAAGTYDDNIAGWVYLKNPGSSTEDYITVQISAGNLVIGRLYGGDWAFFPWEGGGGNDVEVTPSSTTDTTLEYCVFY